MKERIWELFVMRVGQEERVSADQKTLQYLNAYYAVFAAAAAVLSGVYTTDSWKVFAIMTTVLTAIMTVFVCSNPFGARLQMIRRDLAELEQLNDQADGQAEEKEMLGRLQLIIVSGAGVGAQERRAYDRIKDRSEKWKAAMEGRPAAPKRLCGYEKFLYWFWEISKIILIVLMALMPVAGMVLAACGLL